MSKIRPWFERSFDFGLSVEYLPTVCARLRGTPARIEELLRDVPGHVMLRKHDAQWSAQEHAGHLLSLEPLWMARLNDYLAGQNTLTEADLTNRQTHEANYNARPLNDILAEFRSARNALVCRAENLDSGLATRSIIHPRLKQPMRLIDHFYFVAEHDDHHLARIWEIVRDRDRG